MDGTVLEIQLKSQEWDHRLEENYSDSCPIGVRAGISLVAELVPASTVKICSERPLRPGM
jgi:hypothetical protein